MHRKKAKQNKTKKINLKGNQILLAAFPVKASKAVDDCRKILKGRK